MKVLLVGSSGFCASVQESLTGQQFQILRAVTPAEARRHLLGHPDINVVVVNEVIEREGDAMELVSEIRHASAVLTYACCSDDAVGQRFEQAGCHNYLLCRREIPPALADIAASLR